MCGCRSSLPGPKMSTARLMAVWVVWRQNDNGNRFEVARSCCAAQ